MQQKPNHFAKMYLSGRRIAPVQGQHKHERQPKQTALNRRPDVSYVSTAPEEENEKEESSSDDEYIFTLGHEPGKTRVPETNVEINGVEMKMMIDTGGCIHRYNGRSSILENQTNTTDQTHRR